MTIKVSRPQINLRETLSDLKQDTGLKGQELMRADTVAEARTLIGAGRKNLIINGGFDVSQRGDYTSSTSVVDSQYTVDRFKTAIAGATATITHTSDGYGVGSNSLKVTAASTAIGYVGFGQRLEFPEFLGGRVVTISMKMKSNKNNARTYIYVGGQGRLDSVTHSGSGAWETLTSTFTMPTVTGALDIWSTFYDNGTVSVTSGDYIEVAEWQLEIGSVATEFEHRSYGEELALCQRYYQNVRNSELIGAANTSTRMRISSSLIPEMREIPTVARVSGTTVNFQGVGFNVSSTSTTLAQSSQSGTRVMAFDLGGFSSLGSRSYPGGHGNTIVFTADAEL